MNTAIMLIIIFIPHNMKMYERGPYKSYKECIIAKRAIEKEVRPEFFEEFQIKCTDKK